MADKKPLAPQIIDVTGPNQTAPSPTGRPVVVTNRPVLTNDPMMVDQTAAPETGGLPTAPVVSRQARTITPITPGEDEPSESKETVPTPTDTDIKVLEESDEKADPVEDTVFPTKPEMPNNKTEEITVQPVSPNPEAKVAPEAAAIAEEESGPHTPPTDEETAAKKSASDQKQIEEDKVRQQELEALIASGKYAVPINAVQRKRSRMTIAALTFVAVILTVALFDAALDSNVVSLPSVPHTHFFQSR